MFSLFIFFIHFPGGQLTPFAPICGGRPCISRIGLLMQRWIHMEGGASWAIAPLPPHGSGTVPSSVRSAPSSLQFRRDLKTALFQSSYSSP